MKSRLCLALAGVVLVGCSSGSGESTRLALPSDSTVSGRFPNVPIGKPFVVNLVSMCIRSGSPIMITSVDLVKPEGSIKVLDWGVRDRTNGDSYSDGENHPGAAPGKLTDLPGFGHFSVKSTCKSPILGSEFDVDVRMSGTVAISHRLHPGRSRLVGRTKGSNYSFSTGLHGPYVSVGAHAAFSNSTAATVAAPMSKFSTAGDAVDAWSSAVAAAVATGRWNIWLVVPEV
jgi:hypothetical protein